MEKEKKYDDIVARVRSIEPVLEAEDELSAGIMGRIEKLHVRKISSRRMLVAGWMSAAAALFLAGVMFSEILVVSPASVTGTESMDSHRYTGKFKNNISEDEFVEIVKERRKRDEERELIIDRYLKKMQDYEK